MDTEKAADRDAWEKQQEAASAPQRSQPSQRLAPSGAAPRAQLLDGCDSATQDSAGGAGGCRRAAGKKTGGRLCRMTPAAMCAPLHPARSLASLLLS
jgi:hypothetical protein